MLPQRRHLPDGRVWGDAAMAGRARCGDKPRSRRRNRCDGRTSRPLSPRLNRVRAMIIHVCRASVCDRRPHWRERGRHKRHGERDTDTESHGRKTVKFYDGDCRVSRVSTVLCYVSTFGGKRPPSDCATGVARGGGGRAVSPWVATCESESPIELE